MLDGASGTEWIAYYRVSTDRQGRSGLGIEAQQRAVAEFLSSVGAEPVASFTEVESGRKADRPELQNAIAECRRQGAKLIIAKLDRLARNVHFVSGLMEAGVEFTACDMPHANRLTIHVLAAVAEHEREMIAARTTAALAAAKDRGVRLGFANPNLAKVQRRASSAGVDRLVSDARRFAENVAPIVENIRASGVTSLRGIAMALNARGIPARRGGRWHASSVANLLKPVSLS
jgi:DNA invertase Pin-like site-specific DNA recombinase